MQCSSTVQIIGCVNASVILVMRRLSFYSRTAGETTASVPAADV